jgi:hypothetical protein
MTDRQRKTEDDAARGVLDLIRAVNRPRIRPTIPSTADGGGDGASADGMTNPMKVAGDLIFGGDAGAPRRRAIGGEGYLLTVVDGVPAWSVASSAVGRYRSLLYELDGSGGFEWLVDEDGHPMYELMELE